MVERILDNLELCIKMAKTARDAEFVIFADQSPTNSLRWSVVFRRTIWPFSFYLLSAIIAAAAVSNQYALGSELV